MAQMKEQIKTPEKELNAMEISDLSDAEFKIQVVRMLKELSEDLKSIKKKDPSPNQYPKSQSVPPTQDSSDRNRNPHIFWL